MRLLYCDVRPVCLSCSNDHITSSRRHHELIAPAMNMEGFAAQSGWSLDRAVMVFTASRNAPAPSGALNKRDNKTINQPSHLHLSIVGLRPLSPIVLIGNLIGSHRTRMSPHDFPCGAQRSASPSWLVHTPVMHSILQMSRIFALIQSVHCRCPSPHISRYTTSIE